MRFATLKGERDLSDLVGRLFVTRGRRARAVADEAEAALLRANPQLRDLASLPAGATIIVPQVADTKHTDEAWPAEGPAGEIVEEARRAVAGLRTILETSATHQREEARDALRLLKSRELKGLVKGIPGLRGRLPEATEAAKRRLQEADALDAFLTQALAQLDEDLEELVRRLT